MARQLDSPKTVPITHQVIDEWKVTIVRNVDLSVDMSRSNLFYSVLDLNSSGIEVGRTDRRVISNDWPPSFLSDIKSAHKKILQDATNQGLMESGADTDEFSLRQASGSPTITKLTSAGASTIV